MAVYFLESSGIVKRYIRETGTLWVRELSRVAAGNSFYIAQIAGVEVVAAITLRLRRGATTPQEAALAIATFRQDFSRELYAVPVTLIVIKHAMDLAEKHGLRGYDSVQLATALQVQARCRLESLPAPVFLSADNALNAAASAEGLVVDNPNTHV